MQALPQPIQTYPAYHYRSQKTVVSPTSHNGISFPPTLVVAPIQSAKARAMEFENRVNAYCKANHIKLDAYTQAHCERVGKVSEAFARHLMASHSKVLPAYQVQTSEDWVQGIYLSGLFHDLGKHAVPQEILQKSGKLTRAEWDTVHNHPGDGANIIEAIPFSPSLGYMQKAVANGVRCHHEQWNGKGYPSKLRDQQIPLLAQVVSLVDTYVAMTDHRPYKAGETHFDALDKMHYIESERWFPGLLDEFEIFIDNRADLQTPLDQKALLETSGELLPFIPIPLTTLPVTSQSLSVVA